MQMAWLDKGEHSPPAQNMQMAWFGKGEHSPTAQNMNVSKQNSHNDFAKHCTLHDSNN